MAHEAKSAVPGVPTLEVKDAQPGRETFVIHCGDCGQPTMRTNRPVPTDQPYQCEPCAEGYGPMTSPWAEPDPADPAAPNQAILTPHQLAEADQLTRVTPEDAFSEALDDEVEHDVDAQGQRVPARSGRRRWQP